MALATGIAVDLTLLPRDSNWSRRMNGAKGGKASVLSPRHFPIEKARATRSRKAAAGRLKKRDDEDRALPFCGLSEEPKISTARSVEYSALDFSDRSHELIGAYQARKKAGRLWGI
jgi:hypothetical protein